jgi:hypothetical protein
LRVNSDEEVASTATVPVASFYDYVKRSGAIAMHYFMLFYAVTRSSFQSLSEKSWFT